MTSIPPRVKSAPKSAVLEALKKMRSGILWVLVGWVIAFAGLIAAIPAGFTLLSHSDLLELPAVLEAIAPGLALVTARILVSLVGLCVRFVPGVSRLGEVRPEFGTVAGLIKVGYLGALILVPVGLAGTVVSTAPQSPTALAVARGVQILGGILLLVGWIGVIVLCFMLHGEYGGYGHSLYLAAGILMISSIISGLIIPFIALILHLVAWFLLYRALDDTVGLLEAIPAS